MPELDGYALATRVRADPALTHIQSRQLPALEIVALNQLGSAGYAQAALVAGADIFVDKDRLLVDLVPAIHQITGAHSKAIPFES